METEELCFIILSNVLNRGMIRIDSKCFIDKCEMTYILRTLSSSSKMKYILKRGGVFNWHSVQKKDYLAEKCQI